MAHSCQRTELLGISKKSFSKEGKTYIATSCFTKAETEKERKL